MASNTEATEAWNMATETLKRLNRTLNQCSYYSQLGMLPQWYMVTMDLRRNLYAHITEKDWNDINVKLAELPSRWLVKGRVIPQYYSKVNKILDEIYLICIACMKRKGLLMPEAVDKRAAIYRM